MSKKIFVFPGQGSQVMGMGKDLYDNFSEAREVFQEVDDSLGQKLSSIIFEGPDADLVLTANTQPALMAVSLAIVAILKKQSGKDIAGLCDYMAGHSLGEYSALCAAEAINLADTAKLLKLRGQAMQSAVPVGKGGMAAIIGLSFEEVEEFLVKASKLAKEQGLGVIEIANDNSDGQVVVSGTKEAIDAGESIAKEMGAKRYLPLPVSAPFHCSLMQPAADKMQEALEQSKIILPKVKIIHNVTASALDSSLTEVETIDKIRDLLVAQVTGRVRWRETMDNLRPNYDISASVEIGAGKVLTNMIKRADKEIEAINISNIADIESFL